MSTVSFYIPEIDEAYSVRDQLLQKISSDGDLPALGNSISRVVQMASSDDEAVRNLAHFVLSDVGLAQKILRLSNTVCYRTASGTPVTTISKAILLLGFDMVKTSALGLLLVEGMSGKHAHHVRSELAHALSASVIGRELARHSHFKDAEEAAIAALFKNIGRLLVASHDPVRYSEIVALIEKGNHTSMQASMQVMECSFEFLAESVLQQWKIPDTIIQALAPLASGVLKLARNRQEWLQQVAAFSNSAALLIPKMHEPGQESARQTLLARFGTALNLDREKLNTILATVAQETRALTANMAVSSSSVQLMEQPLLPVLETETHGLPDELRLGIDQASNLQVNTRHASGKPMNARDLLLAGVQDMTQMMSSGRCKVNDLMLLMLETLYSSMGFRFATVCLKDMQTNQFRARIAIGDNNVACQAGFVFSAVASRDLFCLAMENDADLLISDATIPKIRPLLPAWYRTLLPDARSFIVLPLVLNKRPIGLFYADRTQPAPEGVPPDETALIKTLKGQVLVALHTR